MTEPDDVDASRRGDTEAFGRLVAAHRAAALRVATVLLGRADGADDVVQIASERAWRSVGSLDPERGFRPWFLGAVANTARNDRRATGRRQAAHERAASRRGTEPVRPDDQAVATLERSAVVEAINDLPPTDRLVLTLRHVELLTEAEIAEVLSCPVGTVKSRHSRALARLRDSLVLKAVIAILLIVIATVVVRPVRETVADWLGLRRTTVRIDPDLVVPDIGLTDGSAVVDRSAAVARVPWVGDHDATIGPPDRYVVPVEGGVVAVWIHEGLTLWAIEDADQSSIVFEKIVASVETVTRLDDLGDGGAVIEGAHVLVTPTRSVAAATTVLWTDGETSLRLDGDLSAAEMEAIARDLAG